VKGEDTVAVLAVLIGYLIGSLSPAYILGRLLRGIDIRRHGTGNAGTRNVCAVLGPWPAAATAAVDLAKGLAAMGLASWLGLPEGVMYAAGYAAVLGHIFPFYIGFRGGEGSATGLGILIFLIVRGVARGWIPLEILLPLAVVAGAVGVISRTGELVGVFCLPFMILLLLLKTPLNPTIVFILVILGQLLFFAWLNLKKLGLVRFGENRLPLTNWRTLVRPLATLFVVLPFVVPREAILFLTGSIAALFIVLDLARLSSRRLNIFLFARSGRLFKEKERSQFSSMTYFLTAVFILLLAFPVDIASFAILFLVYGDLGAKFFGLLYGRTRLLTKTLEGSLAYFAFSFAAGYVLAAFRPLSLWLLGLGALTAAATEVFSIFGIDDNFTVGLVSASLMLACKTLL
jgi:glycerol-3-phosphate acyltransferase PlsY